MLLPTYFMCVNEESFPPFSSSLLFVCCVYVKLCLTFFCRSLTLSLSITAENSSSHGIFTPIFQYFCMYLSCSNNILLNEAASNFFFGFCMHINYAMFGPHACSTKHFVVSHTLLFLSLSLFY